jgi:peptidoglycan/LPS O-acetylase OafA/YrhL
MRAALRSSDAGGPTRYQLYAISLSGLRRWDGAAIVQRLKFLDGLRGWAAVFVLLYHVFCDGIPFDAAVGSQLKLFVPFNGGVGVFIFFVVSGFSLSIDYLARGDLRSWLRTTLGRYFRLAIPIFLACLAVHIAMKLGAIAPPSERLPRFQEFLTFTPTLEHLARFSFYGVFFDYRDSYIGPLWTMRYELAGSFIALLSALALRHTRCRFGSFLVMAAIILKVVPDGDYKMLALFPVGCALADCHLRGWFSLIPNPLGVVLFSSGFAIPLFVPYSVAAWGSAATLLILGSISIPATRAFLENRLSSWLGAICFPLYLIHGPVIWLLGEPLMRNLGHGIAAKIVIEFAVIAASLLAARSFLWTERLAIAIARYIGAAGASVVLPTGQSSREYERR